MNQQITIKAGYLKKQTSGGPGGGGGLIRRQTRRWFVFLIFGGLPSLEYYEDANSARCEAPVNSFDLRGCRRVIRSPGDVCSFILTLSDRVLTLTADTEAEAANWSDTLDRNLAQLAGRQKPDNIYGVFEVSPDAGAAAAASDGGASVDDVYEESDCCVHRDEIGEELRRAEQRVHSTEGQAGLDRFRAQILSASEAGSGGGAPDNGGGELGSLDPAAYALLEKKYRELEDWAALGALLTKRFRSVSGVHLPNPDPPEFRRDLRPIPLAGFFKRKTDVAVEVDVNGRFYVNTLPGGPRLTPLSSAVERLKRQILYPGGVAVSCKSVDLLDNVTIVQCAGGRFWIAGWNRLATRLHSCLHVGDQVVSVDGFHLESLDQLRRILQGSFNEVTLRLRRLPYGKAFCVKRLDGRSLGLQTVGHKAEVCHVQQEGLAAAHGLAYRTAGAVDDANFCTWTITEVNGRPLSLWPEPKEVALRLNAHGQEISLVVQPTDLLKALRGQLKKVRDYKQFVVR